MRKALNENPRVQIAVLGVGGLLLAFMLMTSMGGSEAETEPTAGVAPTSASATGSGDLESTGAPEAEASGSTTGGTAIPSTETVPAEPSATAPMTEPVTPAPGAGSADGLLPGDGLPKDVLVAYAKNKAIALLVVDPKGISDDSVREYTTALRGRDDVAVFVVNAGKIAEYARITQGAAVTRTPSLVVIRPRDRTGDVPTASVSEGFRSAKSVQVALEDALYDGGPEPSFPE